MSQQRTSLMQLRQAIILIWNEATRYVKVRLLIAFALVLAAAVTAAVAPVALKNLIDAFSGHSEGASQPAYLLLGAYVLSHWLGRVLAEARTFVDAQADRRMYRLLSQKLFAHVLALPLRFHLERRTGALNETLSNGLLGYQIVLHQSAYAIVPTIAQFATVAIVLVSLNQAVFLAIFSVALIAYIGAFSYGTSRITTAASAASSAQIDERAVMTDAILNYETVKYFAAESMMRQQFDQALSRTESDWLRFARGKIVSGAAVSTVFALFLAVTGTYAVYQVLQGRMTIGEFVLVNTYIFQLVQPVEVLGFAVQSLAHGIAFLEKMMEILDAPVERRGAGKVAVSGRGSLEFRNVSVGYRSERSVVKDVSFLLQSGHTLGIVGASGAGKSTLVRLLVRLIEPDSGQILLDGVPASDLPLEELRRSIAVVPQDTVLFNDTIAFNIRFGRQGSTQTEVESAARVAHLHDFVMSLPEGYDTVVGERGFKLSGGEKQRVSIARAAIKLPRIYVFDEATSSLDSRTEREILGNLRELSQSSTTLIIAHRLSTVMHADQIVVLEGGAIRERGTHAELRAGNGHYASLWNAQQRLVPALDRQHC